MRMRTRFAQIIAATIFAGISFLSLAAPALAAPNDARPTIEVQYEGYSYVCNTQAQEVENLNLKIDGVQYSCYSAEFEATQDEDSGFIYVLLLVEALALITLLVLWITE